MTDRHTEEIIRIRREYQRRKSEIHPDYYALHRAGNLFMLQGKQRRLFVALRAESLLPLRGRRILDVGCGTGSLWRFYLDLGADPALLAGIDLASEAVQQCITSFASADVRVGDASTLKWADNYFDIVFQWAVFSSVLDPEVRTCMASEMLRVLKPEGTIISYDMCYNNPHNPNVRSVNRRELRRVFPGCKLNARSVTLAPPIARWLAPKSWLFAEFLEALKVLNTHLLVSVKPLK